MLYDIFVRKLHPDTRSSVIFYKPVSEGFSGNVPATEVEEQSIRASLQMALSNSFNSDQLGSIGGLNINPQLHDMIHNDFKKIQEWINSKRDAFYGKHYVSPFYFNEVTEMYDEGGGRIFCW
jgi:hypothetical protein